MTFLRTWFSFHGELTPFDFIVKGFAPGIILGVVALLLDDSRNAHGTIFYPFLAFSLWPAAAMLRKVASSRVQK
jgi:hypothetical protein